MKCPTEIQFMVERRVVNNTNEWVLKTKIGNGDWWVITGWFRQPSMELINKTIDVIRRSMEVYHRHLRVPEFNLKTTQIVDLNGVENDKD